MIRLFGFAFVCVFISHGVFSMDVCKHWEEGIFDYSMCGNIKMVMHQDNAVYSDFCREGHVSDAIVRSCLGAMVYMYKKLHLSMIGNGGESYSQGATDDIVAIIDALEVRLFDMCVAYYQHLNEPQYENKANQLCSVLIKFSREKAEVMLP